MTVSNLMMGGQLPSWDSPATELYAVTASDSVDIVSGGTTRALWVGTAGNINILPAGLASPVIVPNVPAGTLLPIAVQRVYLTSTTASNMVALR